MKKIIIAALLVSLLAGCGQPRVLTVDGKAKEYPTYGLFNQNASKSEKVCYDISVGNVVWSIIGFDSVILPVYFAGFSLFNPVGVKNAEGKCPGIDG